MGKGPKATVYLINPPSVPGTTANREGVAGLGNVYPREGAYLYPPLTIAYAAAALREARFSVRVIDAVVERLDGKAVANRIAEATAITGVLVSYATLAADLSFIRGLKQSRPQTRIVTFGNATRYLQPALLGEAAIDRVLVGEAEGSLAQVCLELGGAAKETNGDLNGRVRDGGFVGQLDSLPLPAWDLLPYSKYPFLSLSSSRGCPDDCTYCPYVAGQGGTFRPRTPDSVASELAWLAKTFSPAKVVFRDPAFALDRPRAEEICRQLADLPIRPAWECESRPEHLDRGLVATLKKAGCTEVKIGVESTDESLLRSVRRLGEGQGIQEYTAHVAQLIRNCGELGVSCRAFTLLGLPGQSKESIQDTAAFLERFPPSSLNVKIFERYPGMRLAEREETLADTLSRPDLERRAGGMTDRVGKAIFKRDLRLDRPAAFRTIRTQAKKRLKTLLK